MHRLALRATRLAQAPPPRTCAGVLASPRPLLLLFRCSSSDAPPPPPEGPPKPTLAERATKASIGVVSRLTGKSEEAIERGSTTMQRGLAKGQGTRASLEEGLRKVDKSKAEEEFHQNIADMLELDDYRMENLRSYYTTNLEKLDLSRMSQLRLKMDTMRGGTTEQQLEEMRGRLETGVRVMDAMSPSG